MDITNILLGLLLVIFGIVGAVVIPWVKTHMSAEQISILSGIAQTAVFAAEKIFGAKAGKDKKAYALELVKNWLAERNLTFDDTAIDAAIEAQVQQLGLDIKSVEGVA